MKHKHADLIKAWADGETVQYLDERSNRWCDMPQDVGIWNSAFKCRIKPKIMKYRVALMASPHRVTNSHSEYLAFAITPLEEEVLRDDANFVRWLTDWIEVAT